MVSTVAADAASKAPGVVSTGAGVFENAKGTLAAGVGQMAQTPKQLEAAGILKPGASTLVNSLVQGGANIQSAMTNNLFTGKAGAENLTSISQNTTAQVKAQVENFQQAQTGLMAAGIITGKEAPTQIAGLVVAGATVGLPATIDFVKNSAGNIANSIGGVTTGATSDVAQLVASGNFAAGMSTTVTGGLASVATSLSGMGKSAITGLSGLVDNAKGLAGSAFSAITKSFKSFVPGVPQNLKEIATANANQQVIDEAQANSPVAAQVSGAIKSSIPSLTNPLSGAVIAAAGSALLSKSSPAVSSLASGITSLPGAAGAITSIVGSSGSSLPNVPGVRQTADLIKNTSAAVTNGITTAASALSGNVASSAGFLSTATNKVESLAGLKGNPISDGLAQGAQSLTSLASAGLPAGAASALQASLSSLSSSSPFPIKLPTIGSNTSSRGKLTAQLGSVLGDKRIPTPNFGGTGPSSSAKAEGDRLNELYKEQQALVKEQDAQSKIIAKARAAYLQAANDLPQGSPEIDSAKQAYIAEVKAFGDITDKIKALANKA
jgi:hypothetical protein